MTSTGPVVPDSRPATPVDGIAEDYVAEVTRLSPIQATILGLPGQESELDDLSPDGYAALADARRATLGRLATAEPTDDVDRVTIEAMAERLSLDEELHQAGVDLMACNVIDSPAQTVREVFDMMPTQTRADWAVVAARLAAVPAALDGWRASLLEAAGRGLVSAHRQVAGVADQASEFAGPDGFFAALVARAEAADPPLDQAGLARVRSGAELARTAYGDAATFLRQQVLPRAPAADACGRDRYQLLSRGFLGTQVDLPETYAWGQAELTRVTQEMQAVADLLDPGGGVAGAVQALDRDPRYRLHGTDSLRGWMQAEADRAIAMLGDHFDIPEPVRRIEACIAPTHSGGIYYTRPSDDFTRPGRMWWAVPRGVDEFTTWRELTTVYHEGVPGHHLQIGQTAYRSGALNRWRRTMSWTSGHGEGWALYAERLMADLGFLDDPGNRLGMLDAQSLRAARVVLDIGLHCGFAAPDEVGGGAWTYEKAWAFLTAHSSMERGMLRFELHRYLGWPGQAPSYKIGERIWLQLRDDAAARHGDRFDLRAFHRDALNLGSVGLDTLRTAMGRW